MVIVIIHWKIKLGDENRAAFLKHWKDMLNISELPLWATWPAFVLCIPVVLQRRGLVRDAFKREVINPHVGKSPKPFDFEFAFRERLVIEPVSWRIGKAKLPAEDSFAK